MVKLPLQGSSNANVVMEYVHFGSDGAAQNNSALLRAIKERHIKISEFLLQQTNKGDYRVPGIAITEETHEASIRAGNKVLQRLSR